jgi:hypothetical protein
LVEKQLVHAIIESWIKEAIERDRGCETRSSFIRGTIVRWYNGRPKTRERIVE